MGWLPAKPVARTGAPQTSHPHALLEAGRSTLEDLFLGFGEEVLAEGGFLADSGTDMKQFDRGEFVADTEARLSTYCASRARFEHVVRRRVRRIETVQIRDDRERTLDAVLILPEGSHCERTRRRVASSVKQFCPVVSQLGDFVTRYRR